MPLAPAGRKAAVTALVLSSVALILPVVGFVGIGFAVAAQLRKSPIGVLTIIVAAVATVLGFVLGVVLVDSLES